MQSNIDLKKLNLILPAGAGAVFLVALVSGIFTRVEFSVAYLPFMLLFVASLVFWIFLLVASLRKSDLKWFFLPIFIVFNFFSIWGLFESKTGGDLIGYCLLANVFIYTLMSLYVFNGKYTQMSMLWGIFAAIVLSSYSGVSFVIILVGLGLFTVLINIVISATSKVWKALPEEELVNIIDDIKSTNYMFAMITICLGLLFLFLQSVEFI